MMIVIFTSSFISNLQCSFYYREGNLVFVFIPIARVFFGYLNLGKLLTRASFSNYLDMKKEQKKISLPRFLYQPTLQPILISICFHHTAGFMKTVPSVYTLLTNTYLSIPDYTGSRGNRFLETHGSNGRLNLKPTYLIFLDNLYTFP